MCLHAGTEELSERMGSLRRLLETELTVASDNNTYPNATVNVSFRVPLKISLSSNSDYHMWCFQMQKSI